MVPARAQTLAGLAAALGGPVPGSVIPTLAVERRALQKSRRNATPVSPAAGLAHQDDATTACPARPAGRARGSFGLDAGLHGRMRAQSPPAGIGRRLSISTVEQGLQGALVARSANDVATAFAERLGSEPVFAQRMTKTAVRLGMTAMHSRNATGCWTRRSRPRRGAMAILGVRPGIKDFPQYHSYLIANSRPGKPRLGPWVPNSSIFAR